MRISIDKNWRVRAACVVEVPLRASAAWGQMRDLGRFLTADPLHAKVRVSPAPGQALPAGATLLIEHRIFGMGPDRVGRVLRWREGRGFAISDLSKRGMRVGFPHVCLYEIEPIGEQSCRLTIGARGRWTARWWPRWAVRVWIWWVMSETNRRVAERFDLYQRWRKAKGGVGASAGRP